MTQLHGYNRELPIYALHCSVLFAAGRHGCPAGSPLPVDAREGGRRLARPKNRPRGLPQPSRRPCDAVIDVWLAAQCASEASSPVNSGVGRRCQQGGAVLCVTGRCWGKPAQLESGIKEMWIAGWLRHMRCVLSVATGALPHRLQKMEQIAKLHPKVHPDGAGPPLESSSLWHAGGYADLMQMV